MNLLKIVIILVLISDCQWIYADEAKNIKNSYSFYKKALEIGDSRAAVSIVTKSSIDYYLKIRELALVANEEALKNSTFTQKMLVLSIRARMHKNELQQMDGRKLFMRAVKSGWISKKSMENCTLGKISVSGSKAYADYMNRGKPSGSKLLFIKESGVWKFDMVSVLDEADKHFEAYVKHANVSENRMVEVLVEKVTGQKVTPALWNGFQR